MTCLTAANASSTSAATTSPDTASAHVALGQPPPPPATVLQHCNRLTYSRLAAYCKHVHAAHPSLDALLQPMLLLLLDGLHCRKVELQSRLQLQTLEP
jgi:hypothetical protein